MGVWNVPIETREKQSGWGIKTQLLLTVYHSTIVTYDGIQGGWSGIWSICFTQDNNECPNNAPSCSELTMQTHYKDVHRNTHVFGDHRRLKVNECDHQQAVKIRKTWTKGRKESPLLSAVSGGLWSKHSTLFASQWSTDFSQRNETHKNSSTNLHEKEVVSAFPNTIRPSGDHQSTLVRIRSSSTNEQKRVSERITTKN